MQSTSKKNQQKTILIVEDERLLTKALQEKLESQQYQVLSARDGAEGIEKALTHKPDLILLDIIMPVMDGVTMLKKLREDAWGKTANVIVLSNLSEIDTLDDAASTASGYLVKTDWTLEDLVNEIEKKLQ